MKTNTMTRIDTSADVGLEVSKFALGVCVAMAALVGIWGAACLIGGLAAAGGPVALTKGFMMAITGV